MDAFRCNDSRLNDLSDCYRMTEFTASDVTDIYTSYDYIPGHLYKLELIDHPYAVDLS